MTIEWKSQSGAMIRVGVRRYINCAVADATVAGKAEIATSIAMLATPQTISGMRIVAAIGRVGLTAERLAALQAEIAALQTEINSEPAVQRTRLVEQRTELAQTLGWILDAAYEAQYAAIERAGATGVYRDPADLSAKESAARAALRDFDAAHPEVAGWIEDDRNTEVKQFLERD